VVVLVVGVGVVELEVVVLTLAEVVILAIDEVVEKLRVLVEVSAAPVVVLFEV